MKLQIVTNEFFNNSEQKQYSIDVDIKRASLGDTVRQVVPKGKTISFEDYYVVSSQMMAFSNKLPYILRGGKYVWNIDYDDVTIYEFMTTHSIGVDSPIIVELDYYGAGGLDASELYKWVENLLADPIVLSALVKAGIDGLKVAINQAIKKYKNVNKMPGYITFIGLLESRNEWDFDDLTKALNVNETIVKKMLYTVGFIEVNGKYKLDKKKNDRFHYYSEKKTPNDTYLGDINIGLAYLKCMQTIYDIHQDMSEIDAMIESLSNKSNNLVRGNDVETLKFRKGSERYVEKHIDKIIDQLTDLQSLINEKILEIEEKSQIDFFV